MFIDAITINNSKEVKEYVENTLNLKCEEPERKFPDEYMNAYFMASKLEECNEGLTIKITKEESLDKILMIVVKETV